MNNIYNKYFIRKLTIFSVNLYLDIKNLNLFKK